MTVRDGIIGEVEDFSLTTRVVAAFEEKLPPNSVVASVVFLTLMVTLLALLI